jgi:hypothetical protein
MKSKGREANPDNLQGIWRAALGYQMAHHFGALANQP